MLTTPAWLLPGMGRNIPGALSWDDRRLRFASAEEVVFDLAPGDVQDIVWPRLWMGGGCKLQAPGERYKVSFVQPNGAPDITDALLGDVGGVLGAVSTVGDLGDALSSFSDVRKGRDAGKAWKPVLDEISRRASQDGPPP